MPGTERDLPDDERAMTDREALLELCHVLTTHIQRCTHDRIGDIAAELREGGEKHLCAECRRHQQPQRYCTLLMTCRPQYAVACDRFSEEEREPAPEPIEVGQVWKLREDRNYGKGGGLFIPLAVLTGVSESYVHCKDFDGDGSGGLPLKDLHEHYTRLPYRREAE